jgi:serine/threonine protein kinase
MNEPSLSEESIFTQALDIPSAAERSAYLDRACGGDRELRAEVEALLRAHQVSGDLLDLPDKALAAVDEPVRGGPGAVIGPYKLLEQIGEGGFGVVFMAEQQQPVRRQVALKVLKPGMDSKQVVARFEAERQALALMDHPNIARVFDGGATASGRPYFVMELVKGVPITHFCDLNQLSVRERLGLFITVCQAVQHAHQKGVIHRDLKPSNVPVTLHDGTPMAKVIDFGIAKAVGQQLTDKTLFTGFAQMIGTPLYMSPEQAALSNLDVDTRSDVYSLGVLLYELLTGTTPFEQARLSEVGYDELRRIIQEEEPRRPSTRISTLGQAATTVSTQRKSDPKRLSQLFRGELDWIVMKALEKDRNRRYESASAFAADVQRYLNDEPVLACPPSAWYRLRKFARRNKGPVLALGVILFVLSVGIIGTAWQAARATRERNDKQAALQRVVEEEQEARAALKRAMAALRSLTEDVVGQQLARHKLDEVERAFLRNIVAQYEAFAALKGDTPDGRTIRAEGYFRIGILRHWLGEQAEARASFDRARELYRQLADDFPGVLEHRSNLAAIHHNLGSLLRELGRHGEAEAEHRAALALREALVADPAADPDYRADLANSHRSLGKLLMELGRRDEAGAELRRALALRKQLADDFPAVPEHRVQLADGHGSLGDLLKGLGTWGEAEAEYRHALALRKQLADDFPAVPARRELLADSHRSLGDLLQQLGKCGEAEAEYRAALALQKRLADDFPSASVYRQSLADSHNSLGALLKALRKWGDAEAEFRVALALRKQLADDFPAAPARRKQLADSHNNLGLLLQERGKRGEAEVEYRHALAVAKQLAADFPAVPDYLRAQSQSHTSLGILLKGSGRMAEAEAEYRLALALCKQLADRFPGVPHHVVDLGGGSCNLANLLRDSGRPVEALDAYQQAVQALAPVVEREPRLVAARQFLRNSHWGRAQVLTRLGRIAEATQDWDRSIELDDGSARGYLRLQRASSRARVEPAKAVTEAEELIRGQGAPASWLYCAACVYSVSSGRLNDHGERDRYAARAVALLHRARECGYFREQARIQQLKRDPDFDPLRRREDFKRLIDGLERNTND